MSKLNYDHLCEELNATFHEMSLNIHRSPTMSPDERRLLSTQLDLIKSRVFSNLDKGFLLGEEQNKYELKFANQRIEALERKLKD